MACTQGPAKDPQVDKCSCTYAARCSQKKKTYCALSGSYILTVSSRRNRICGATKYAFSQGVEECVRLLWGVRPYVLAYMKGARIPEGYRRTISQAREDNCTTYNSRVCDVVLLYPSCKSIYSELLCELLYCAVFHQGKRANSSALYASTSWSI